MKNKINYYSKLSFLFILIIFLLLLKIYFYNKSDRFLQTRIQYIKILNRTYNESNLVTFEDKLNWLVIHDTNILKGKCADKILLHRFSRKKLGKDICNKILKIYNNELEINLKELPNQFVLKTNHGSGYNIIVENKTNFNLTNAQIQLRKWMNIDYGKYGAEFHYSFINRKIFTEEYIGKDLKNYKFLCYNGKPKYVYLSIKEGNNKYRNFYDMQWNFINYSCLSQPHPLYKYPMPKLFQLMKKYAKILSEDFKFVRVDLYELKNEVKLGELTFIPMNSFFFCKNKQDEIDLGKDIIINT